MPLTFYAPDATKAELQARAAAPGKSQVIVLLDAVIATRDRMPGILAAYHNANRPPVTGGFVYPQPKAATPEGSANINMRISEVNMNALDALVQDVDEWNRSLYLRLALETYFAETRGTA